MNSRIMILLAVLLLLGASVAGYLGYSTTQDAKRASEEARVKIAAAEQAAAIGVAGKSPVLVARQAIPAFKTLTADDLAIDYLRLAPPNSYRKLEEVLGKPVQVALQPGELLQRSHLFSGSEMSRLLRPGERALAIPIDEVVGGGGFVQPGDLVDVLLFLRGEAGARDSAQIVMQALRVIGFGAEIIGNDGAVANPANRSDRAHARTAVLAVPEAEVTRMMLASSLGTLRLAIRPPASSQAVGEPAQAAPATPAPLTGQQAPALAGAAAPVAAAAPVPASTTQGGAPAQSRLLTSSALQPGGRAAAPATAAAPSAPRRAPARRSEPRAAAAPTPPAPVAAPRPQPAPVLIYRGLEAQGAR